MTSAFQYSAFQQNAFQIDALDIVECQHDYVVAGYMEAGFVCGFGTQTQTGGGIGHGGKRKRRFVERDGKILVFETAEEAARFVEAEQAEKPVKRTKKPKLKVVPKPKEIIEPKAVNRLANTYSEWNYASKLYEAYLQEDMARVVAIYHKLQEIDEEEVEILLLAA